MNGTVLGRQPIFWTALFGQILSVGTLFYNAFKPADAPAFSVEMVVGLNALFAAFLALVANAAVTPVSDARLNNGTQVNSGASVVIPVEQLNGQRAADVIVPVSPYTPS